MGHMHRVMTARPGTVFVDKHSGAEFALDEVSMLVAEMIRTDTKETIDAFCERFVIPGERESVSLPVARAAAVKTMTDADAASGAVVDAVSGDEPYYRMRFESLIEWLEKNEKLHEDEAQADMSSDEMESAQKNLAISSMAKRTRMWIRNHVLFSR